ncbi:MAG TPA: DUF2147 domain-containing protein [Methylocystis sp.]|nr:DUF2147 domain-containing protein [Methylocystis sp.]
MKISPYRAALLAAALLAPTAVLAGPAGKWRVGDGSAVIKVHDCGAGLCGAIDTIAERGAKDENNPNPAQRSRPLLGLTIMSLQKSGENMWQGTIYNAQNGQNYSAKLTQTSEASLTLEGCVAGTNLCGEDHWTRVR